MTVRAVGPPRPASLGAGFTERPRLTVPAVKVLVQMHKTYFGRFPPAEKGRSTACRKIWKPAPKPCRKDRRSGRFMQVFRSYRSPIAPSGARLLRRTSITSPSRTAKAQQGQRRRPERPARGRWAATRGRTRRSPAAGRRRGRRIEAPRDRGQPAAAAQACTSAAARPPPAATRPEARSPTHDGAHAAEDSRQGCDRGEEAPHGPPRLKCHSASAEKNGAARNAMERVEMGELQRREPCRQADREERGEQDRSADRRLTCRARRLARRRSVLHPVLLTKTPPTSPHEAPADPPERRDRGRAPPPDARAPYDA